MGGIKLVWGGFSFPGRYGHGKPAKPVNTVLSALHSFQSYIFPCAFKGIFTLARVRTFVLGFFCLIVYTRRQKSVIITETRILSGKTPYYHAKVDTRRQNPYTNTETACIITETGWEFP